MIRPFPLSAVRLLDGPFRAAQDADVGEQVLLELKGDQRRSLREAGQVVW